MARLILICCFLGVGMLPAQSLLLEAGAPGKRVREAMDAVYNLHPLVAETRIAALRADFPDHPGPWIMRSMNAWWQIVSNEKYTGFDQQMQESLDSAFHYLDRYEPQTEAENAEKTLCEFLAWSQQSRLEASREKWTASVFSARKVLGPMKRAVLLKNTYPEFLLPSGLYNYYAVVFPQQYPIVKPFMWLFPDGDKQLGLEEITQAYLRDPVSRGEAGYFLVRILLEEENEYRKAFEVVEEMIRYYPDNTFFRMLRIKVLYQLEDFAAVRQQTAEWVRQFESIPNSGEKLIHSGISPLTSQLMKDIYFYRGLAWISETGAKDHELALRSFRESLRLSHVSGYAEAPLVASTWYHIGVCEDNLGNREEALAAYRQARDAKNAGPIKKKAKSCMETPCTYDF